MKRTLNASTISWGLHLGVRNLTNKKSFQSYQIVLVIAVPADGAMTLARILYFFPSMERVLVRPVMAALAVEYCKKIRKPVG
jgi:hypothetical protein